MFNAADPSGNRVVDVTDANPADTEFYGTLIGLFCRMSVIFSLLPSSSALAFT